MVVVRVDNHCLRVFVTMDTNAAGVAAEGKSELPLKALRQWRGSDPDHCAFQIRQDRQKHVRSRHVVDRTRSFLFF